MLDAAQIGDRTLLASGLTSEEATWAAFAMATNIDFQNAGNDYQNTAWNWYASMVLHQADGTLDLTKTDKETGEIIGDDEGEGQTSFYLWKSETDKDTGAKDAKYCTYVEPTYTTTDAGEQVLEKDGFYCWVKYDPSKDKLTYTVTTTNGKLNIAMGSVLRIWHDYREAAEANTNEADNKLPEQEALDAAARHCDISNLVIDENARTVYLSDPDMSLDVGSVGKGCAVEMVAQAAEARGLKSALISVGGNLRAIGTKPDGSQCVGGVENPWNSSEVYTNGSSTVAAVKMSDLSLVTSGDYQRYYVVDGVRYHHLIDPATLWPAADCVGVSVLAPDSGVADCLTTGVLCLSLEDGKQLVESLDGVEALWCTTDGEVITSSGWSEHTN